ncbi:hypothetical protein HDU76_001966 [Blyttiomyces sp. JEL0837]|nr:hypothetical protein HDU76_001966 [Blyttiomyces sp. JEL0837]
MATAPLFSFPHYLLPYILDSLKEDVNTLKELRLVSTTWQHFSDRVFLPKIRITTDNINEFVRWARATTLGSGGNNNEKQQEQQTPTNRSPVPTPSCKTFLQSVHYVEFYYRDDDDGDYTDKLKEALRAIPNLKCILGNFGHRASQSERMVIYNALLERKQSVTHLDITYPYEYDENVIDVARKFLSAPENGTSSSLSNLRFLNLDFGDYEFGNFEFGWLKNLVNVDTMFIKSTREYRGQTCSLIKILDSLPQSLRRLKLDIPRNYTFQSTTFQLINPQGINQLNNLQVLEVMFNGHISSSQISNSGYTEKVTIIKQIFSWLMPNLEVFKLRKVVVLHKNEIPGFLDSAFAAFAWALIKSMSDEMCLDNVAEFHRHVVHVYFHGSSTTSINKLLVDDQGNRKIAMLESLSLDGLSARDKRFCSSSYLEVLKVYGDAGLTHLYLIDDRIPTWYQILEGKESEAGTLFPRLQVVTLVCSDMSWINKLEVKGYIQGFVDFLPETVMEIRVGGGLQFCKPGIIDVLEQYASQRGIRVVTGKFNDPSELIHYPRSVEDLRLYDYF